MKSRYFFDNLQVLETVLLEKVLISFDFDGTLAPIVSSPNNAQIANMTLGYLKQINDIVPTAIISGRSLEDLKSKLPFSVKYLIGNHGLEGDVKLPPNIQSIEEIRRICRYWCEFLEKSLIQKKGISGIEIEDKKFSIAIHYRHAENKEVARLEVINSISKMGSSPRVILAKSAVNIIPPGSPDKGMTLLSIMESEKAKCAFYIGDDDSDEDVFVLKDKGFLTIP